MVIDKRLAKDGTVSYRVRVRIKPHPQQVATFARITEAREWGTRTEAALLEHRHFPDKAARTRTLGALLQRYRVEVLPGESPSARSNKATHLTWWERELGHLTLAAVTPAQIAQAVQTLQTAHASATTRRYLSTLSRAYRVAVQVWGWPVVNPVASIEKPTEPPGRTRWLTQEECTRLLEACAQSRNPYLYLLVVLELHTGARKRELLSIKRTDVDLARGEVTVWRSKTKRYGTLPLPPLCVQLLRGHLDTLAPGVPWVFPRKDGLAPIEIRQAWETARRQAGLADVRYHDLRHTFASYLAMSGATVREIQEALGDRTLAMATRYTHLSEAHTRSVVERMAQQFLQS